MIRNQVIRFQPQIRSGEGVGVTAPGSSDPTPAEISWLCLQEYSKAQELGLKFISEPSQNLQELKTRPDLLAVRIPLEDSPEQLPRLSVRPAEVNQIKGFDHWIYEGSEFIVRSLWAKTIRSLIIAKVRSLDIRQDCLIVGEGAWLRMAAWVAAGLGYSNIHLVGENPGDLAKQVKSLESVLVGLKLHAIPADKLTMQTIKCSLLLNCIDLNNRNELFGDIVYFNFMSARALVVDLPSFRSNHDLLSEADSAGLLILESLDVQAQLDFDFLLALKIKNVLESQRVEFGEFWRSKT